MASQKNQIAEMNMLTGAEGSGGGGGWPSLSGLRRGAEAAIPPSSVPAPPVFTSEQEYTQIAIDEAMKQGVDPLLVVAIMKQESNFNPKAVSKKGARGLMQLIPAVSKKYGITNPDDPTENIRGGVRLIKELHRTVPQLGRNRGINIPVTHETILAAYNWRPSRFGDTYKKYGNKWREHLPDETRNYINKVSENYIKYMMP